MLIDFKTVEQARSIDVINFFEQHNSFTFNHQGGTYRCRQHPSLAVKNDRLSWYWHSKNIGGFGVLDYLIKIENLHFREAVQKISGTNINIAPKIKNDQGVKSLFLPEKADTAYRRLYAYLCITRGIDNNIITTLIQEKKIYEDKRGDIVFIGYDENNTAKFACLRGTYTGIKFRMDCAGSDKRYSFNMAYSASEKLYIFEAPIDALAHAALENIIAGNKDAWLNDNRISLGGTSCIALDKYLELNPAAKELVLCLDNDSAGREAAVNMARKYSDKNYYTRIELSKYKDYSDDLINHKNLNK